MNGSRFQARHQSTPDKLASPSGHAVGPAPTWTVAGADHWLVVRATEVETVARVLAARLGVLAEPSLAGPCPEELLAALAGDLKANACRCMVLTGDRHPATVHALVHAMNSAPGNVSRTVSYITRLHGRHSTAMSSLRELVEVMNEGRVEAFFILGTDPAYSAPSDLQFGQHLARVPFRVLLGPAQQQALACGCRIPTITTRMPCRTPPNLARAHQLCRRSDNGSRKTVAVTIRRMLSFEIP